MKAEQRTGTPGGGGSREAPRDPTAQEHSPAHGCTRGKAAALRETVASDLFRKPLPLVAALVAVALALAWSSSGVFEDLAKIWRTNDDFSSGALVPALAIYIVIAKRRELATVPVRACRWGVLLIVLGFAMRFAGWLLFYGSAERLSIVLVIVGLVLTMFGPRMTRRLGWVLAFLLLMMPWPNRLYMPVSLKLQTYATSSTVFVLELLGYFVRTEGNIIHIGDATVAVAEACSGLRMLTAFMVVSAFIAFLSGRSWWEKSMILICSIPIAIICNTVRLTATSIAFTRGYGQQANAFFHDFGGVAMMPLALAMVVVVLWFLKSLFPQERVGGEGIEHNTA